LGRLIFVVALLVYVRLPLMFHSLERLTRLRFQPTLVPTLAAVLVFALTIHLGNWQRGRAAEKTQLQASLDRRVAEPPVLVMGKLEEQRDVFRRATAKGVYDAAGQIFLDNKSEGAAVGYHVVTPLLIEGTTQVLLVNRGFVPRSAAYPAPPFVDVPTGLVEVRGTLSLPNAKFLELGEQSPVQGTVWQNLTIDRYRQRTGRDVAGLMLLANPTDAALTHLTEQPDAKVAKHVEYMLTWYSLATTVVLLWLVLNLKLIESERSE
jgi:surfeit locus 1 family protein